MHEMVRESWMRFNEPLEGIVNFMYLDVKGWVSTGMGNKIDETVRPNSAPSAAERQASLRLANQLNWYDQSTGAAASPAEVAAAWDAVKDRIAQSENVRAALLFVARGEAPLGIVYQTDAAAEPNDLHFGADAQMERFRAFLDTISPDDFEARGEQP